MLPIPGYLRSALLWAMIPLTLFASRPVTGCTCASGEYKLFCMAHVLHGKAVHDSNGNSTQCEKACCSQHKNVTDSAPCCQKGHCSLSDAQGKPAGNKCCNPDMLTAVTIASAVTFSLDNSHQVLFDLPVVESGTVFADLAIAHPISHETGPPGGDLVVSLRRLLV